MPPQAHPSTGRMSGSPATQPKWRPTSEYNLAEDLIYKDCEPCNGYMIRTTELGIVHRFQLPSEIPPQLWPHNMQPLGFERVFHNPRMGCDTSTTARVWLTPDQQAYSTDMGEVKNRDDHAVFPLFAYT